MSPKRLERVAPPPIGEEWDVKFGDSKAAKSWQELCAHALVATREAFELMRENPRPVPDGMHYQLRGELSTRDFGGQKLEQWQVKVSNSGRIWYLVDDLKHTVWVVYASAAHPKATE